MENLLTTKQLSKYLQLKPVTIRRKVAKGEIPAVKVGRYIRFNKVQVDEWLFQSNGEKSVKILVIDDEPIVGDLIRDTLENIGCQVTTILSSRDAMEITSKEHFTTIFLDLLMPEFDGSEVLKHIRKVNKNVPVVIITGYPNSDVMERAMEYGPLMVIKKPFNSEQILNAVHSFALGTQHKMNIKKLWDGTEEPSSKLTEGAGNDKFWGGGR